MKRFSTNREDSVESRKRSRLDASIEAEEAVLFATRQVSDLQRDLSERDARIRKLEAQLAFLNERDEDRRETALEAATQTWSQEKIKYERELQQARESEGQAVAQHEELVNSLRKAQHELEMAGDRIAGLQQTIETVQNTKAEALVENTAPPVTVQIPTHRAQDDAVIQQELSRQVKHIKRMQLEIDNLTKENKAHRTKHESISLLKEQNTSLQVQLNAMHTLQRTLAETRQSLNDALIREEAWMTFLSPHDEDDTQSTTALQAQTPQEWARGYQSTLLELKTAREKSAALSSIITSLRGSDGIISILEARVAELESDSHKQKERRLKAEEETRSSSRIIRLLKQERDFLKEQLATFSTEEQLMHPETFDQRKAEQILGLEKLLLQHQEETKSLSDQLKELQVLPSKDKEEEQGLEQKKLNQAYGVQSDRIVLLTDELAASRNELAVQQTSNASLQLQLDALKEKLGTGQYNPSTTQVLSLQENPASNDIATRTMSLKVLRAENEALLAAMHWKHKEGPEVVPKETVERLRLELETAKEQIKNAEKTSDRLKDAFRKKAADLRRAVATLLGYSLEIKQEDQLRLTSIYAPSKQHSLLFSVEPSASTSGNSSRDFNLIGDGEAGLNTQEKRSLEFWVKERKCWPGFLASVLLEQYESVTRGGKHLGFVGGD